VPARIREWAALEIAAGRLLPWLAVAYGFGIVLYFTAGHEPLWWAAVALAAICIVAAVLARRRATGFVMALGVAAIASGFAVATVRTALIAHPVLRFSTSGVTIGGFVELREESQHTDRFVLRVDHIEGGRMEEKPQRVRLSVKRGMAPAAGSYVEVKAMLDPPMQPLEPGSYDFARDLFFQGIGASGFVRGSIKIVAPPQSQGALQSADAIVQDMRDDIDARIRAVLPGDPGAIAAMLINGRRDSIDNHLYDAMFVSGIGHVLSISGYHMAVVAGMIFFLFRAGLALIPGLADRAPIKKWAAFAALLVTAFYLVLSGNQVATQRSFIMIAVVLIGVMADRPTLTMRTLTVAALIVLFFAPEAVVHPSFQMSFAATLALVAGYERGAVKVRAGRDSSLGARAALWGVNEIVGLTLASLLAGFATTPYAALSLPSPRALRRAGQSLGHAGGVGVGDADGHPRRRHDAVRLRCRMLAADGLRHRMDGCGVAVGGEPARRLWPGHVVRHRTAALCHRGPAHNGTAQDAIALEWCTLAPCRDSLGRAHGRAGRVGGRGRPHLRGTRRRRQARVPSHRRRHLCDSRMAGSGCRRPRRQGPRAGAGHRLRSVRLYRQACRRRAGRLCARTRCFRGRLPPRYPRRGDA